MTREFSNGHPSVLAACNVLSKYYFYNIFLQKSCRFSLQTLAKFEAVKTGSGVGFLRLTPVDLSRVAPFTTAGQEERRPWVRGCRSLHLVFGRVRCLSRKLYF